MFQVIKQWIDTSIKLLIGSITRKIRTIRSLNSIPGKRRERSRRRGMRMRIRIGGINWRILSVLSLRLGFRKYSNFWNYPNKKIECTKLKKIMKTSKTKWPDWKKVCHSTNSKCRWKRRRNLNNNQRNPSWKALKRKKVIKTKKKLKLQRQNPTTIYNLH